jgi:hypothetical protein
VRENEDGEGVTRGVMFSGTKIIPEAPAANTTRPRKYGIQGERVISNEATDGVTSSAIKLPQLEMKKLFALLDN